MSERRKDSKGRVLRTGESERKDGLYQFRYEDISGKRQTIYDRDLNELRKKEKEIQKQLDEGVSFNVMDKVYESMELLEKRCNSFTSVLSYPVAVFRKHDEKPKTPLTPFVHKKPMV